VSAHSEVRVTVPNNVAQTVMRQLGAPDIVQSLKGDALRLEYVIPTAEVPLFESWLTKLVVQHPQVKYSVRAYRLPGFDGLGGRRAEHTAYQRAYGPGPALIRTAHFKPYRRMGSMGESARDLEPTFTLTLYDTHRRDARGQTNLGYKLARREAGKSEMLFEGEDFSGSPMHADDSDETVMSLLSFLTLKPGDTDADYFENYTPRQLKWAESGEAEALEMEARSRFGLEDY
jgi:hypothetical protein